MNRVWWLVVGLLGVVSQARGHATSLGRLEVEVEGRAVSGVLTLSTEDLDALFDLDADGDRRATRAEVASRSPAIARYVRSHLELWGNATLCRLTQVRPALAEGALRIDLAAACERGASAFSLRYELLFEHDVRHRGMVHVRTDGKDHRAVLTSDQREFAITGVPAGALAGFGEHVREGMWHIWGGFDHLLFLLTLLLPVIDLRGRRSGAPKSARQQLFEVLKVVTAFTLAHSLTLGLASFQWVRVSSRLVESLIAASVVVSALANLSSRLDMPGPRLAFGFGLLHGFGFAGALTELGVSSGAMLPALLGFNLGVELGQLACVSVFFALVCSLRFVPFSGARLVAWASWATLAIASMWLLERSLAIRIVEPLLDGLAHTWKVRPWAVALFGAAFPVGLWWGNAQLRRRRGARAYRGLVIGLCVTLCTGLAGAAWAGHLAARRATQRASAAKRSAEQLRRGGRLEAAHRSFLLAGEAYAEAGDLRRKADMLSRAADLELASARPESARARYLTVLDLREQQADKAGMIACYHSLATLERATDHPAQAARFLRRAIVAQDEIGRPAARRLDRVALAQLYRETDQLASAAQALTTAVALDRAEGWQTELADDLSALARVEQLRGRYRAAQDLYGRAIPLFRAQGRDLALAKALANAATTARHLGDQALAGANYQRALTRFQRAGDLWGVRRVKQQLAKVPSASGPTRGLLEP